MTSFVFLVRQLRRLCTSGALLWAAYASIPAKAETTIITGMEARCALEPGATSFIIRLPDAELPRDFTLLNTNSPAAGRFSIAVASEALPPESPRWQSVGGMVKFRHKRLFQLSLVGVEARYLKLTFLITPSQKTNPESPRAIASQAAAATPLL